MYAASCPPGVVGEEVVTLICASSCMCMGSRSNVIGWPSMQNSCFTAVGFGYQFGYRANELGDAFNGNFINVQRWSLGTIRRSTQCSPSVHTYIMYAVWHRAEHTQASCLYQLHY